MLLLFPLLDKIKLKMPDECASTLCYRIHGNTEANRSHSPWRGDPHLVLLTCKSFEGPKDFDHFQLLFYPFML